MGETFNAGTLSIIQIISLVATIIISSLTLYKSSKAAKNDRQASVLTQKRSERITEIRTFSASILSLSEIILYKNGIDAEDEKTSLITSVRSFNSVLQYIYDKDIELIDLALDIKQNMIHFGADSDRGEVLRLLNTFWKKCDLYVGVEFERLNVESSGKFNKLGTEEAYFAEVYEKLVERETMILPKRKY